MWGKPATGNKAQASRSEARRNAALGEALLQQFGVSKAELVPSKAAVGFTGFTYNNELLIGAPWPTSTLEQLFVLAHEIGHLRLHVRRNKDGWYCLSPQPNYVLEYEAERFAVDWFGANGLEVPPSVLAKARQNVANKIADAEAAGDVPIALEIAEWAHLDDHKLQEVTDGGRQASPCPTCGHNERCQLGLTRAPSRLIGRRSTLRELMIALLIIGVGLALWARLTE